MAYTDKNYDDERYQRDKESSNLMQRIKRDVKSWFDFDDDDDDRNETRSYDFRDRSGRRHRSQSDNEYSNFAQDRDVKRPGNTYTRAGSRDNYSYDERARAGGRYYSEGRDFERDSGYESDRGRDYDVDRSGRESTGPYTHTYMEAWIIPGPFVGRGPKGYKRSSEALKDRVCERLQSDGRIDASDIDVSVDDNCEVTLEGQVQDRRQKRLAEDCVETLPGVEDVHNRLRISRGTGYSTDASNKGSFASQASLNEQTPSGKESPSSRKRDN